MSMKEKVKARPCIRYEAFLRDLITCSSRVCALYFSLLADAHGAPDPLPSRGACARAAPSQGGGRWVYAPAAS